MTKRGVNQARIDRSTIVEFLQKINHNRQITCKSKNERYNHKSEHQWKIPFRGSIEKKNENR